MRKLNLKSKQYEQLLKGLSRYLKAKGYSHSTWYNATGHAREFLHYQEGQKRKLKDWKAQDLKDFVGHLKTRLHQRRAGALSSSHINKIIQSLHLLQDYLSSSEQLDFYEHLPQLRNHHHEPNIFTKEEIKYLYSSLQRNVYGLRMRAILSLCYGCGLRKGEAIQLNLADIWWDKKLLQVRKSKTGRERLVPINTSIVEDFRNYAQRARTQLLGEEKQAAFLVSNRGERLSSGALYQAFQSYLKRIGLPLSGLHSLRHSIASHLASSGMESAQIAKFLGHKTLDSTQIYVHLNAKNNEYKNLP
ncbi:MAG: tyrosine-type recombinase/integrase [Saprospiraceae bacterium]|nr:tyrosine-type recombinase/integrase [Saprospiraceae bacterium]